MNQGHRQIREMSFDTLEALYQRHERGEKLSDQDWTSVDNACLSIAHSAVRFCAERFKIPRHTRENLVEDVRLDLLTKFLKCRLKAANFRSLITTVARRATITCLRKIKSPMAGPLEYEGQVRRTDHAAAEEFHGDVFLAVRSRMGAFRFPEHAPARDALLAARLASDAYPPPDYLRAMVPGSVRRVVYNAAVFAINTSLMRIRDGLVDDSAGAA